MTLIACTIINRRPTLIGDVLITTGAQTIYARNDEFHIPTDHQEFGNSRDIAESAELAGFNQKIYIITPHLCLALAGYVWYAQEFLKGAKDRFRYVPVNDENVIDFIKEYEPGFLQKITYIFLGYTSVEGKNFHFVRHSSDVTNGAHPYFGKYFVSGTGRPSEP